MMDHVLRQTKDRLFIPVAEIVGEHVSPLAITLVAGGVGVLAAIAAWQGLYGIGLGLWLLNRLLDGLDGAVARSSGRQTELGGYLDILIDFVMYTIIPLGLALHQPSVRLLGALAFMFGTFYVNAVALLYLSAILEQRRQGAKQRAELTTIAMPPGIVEGAEAIIFFTLFFLLPGQLEFLFVLMGLMVIATTLQHVIWATRHLK